MRMPIATLILLPFITNASLKPINDENIIEAARVSMSEHLEEEGLTIDDAKFTFAYQDENHISTIYFEVEEHEDGKEYYEITCNGYECTTHYK